MWTACLVNTVVNLLVLPKLRRGAPVEGPLLSVVIPARNEERAIERTVRALLAQTYAAIEVIVVNDRSSDATAAILESIVDPRLRVIAGEEPPAGWLGKPWALHQGAAVASGELLLFVDADIFYDREAVAAAVSSLRDSGASMLTMLPNVEMHGFWENVAMPHLAAMVYIFLPAWLSNKTRHPHFGIGGGTGNLIVRDDYLSIGGHEALRDAVVDDVALAHLTRRRHRRTLVARAESFVSVRMYRGGREIMEGFTKNVFVTLRRSYALTVLVAILGLLYHVFPYVAALAGNPIAIATVIVITTSRLILFGALGYNIAAALLAHPLMILFWTWLSFRSMWKTGVKRELAWRGRTYDAGATRFGGEARKENT